MCTNHGPFLIAKSFSIFLLLFVCLFVVVNVMRAWACEGKNGESLAPNC